MNDVQKIYELACLLAPNLSEDRYATWSRRLGEIIQTHAGEVLEQYPLKEQKLAYAVHKQTQARLAVIQFRGAPTTPLGIEADLKHEQEMVRHLIIELPLRRRVKAKVSRKTPILVEPAPAAPSPKSVQDSSLEEIDKRIEEILKSAS